MMRASSTILLRAALLGATAIACSNAGDGLGIKLPAGPNVVAQVFYDRNFDNGPSAGDTAFAGIKIYLLVAGTRDTVDSATTVAAGAVSFASPAVGPYIIAVDSAAALGDSMVMTLTPATVTVVANGPTALIVGRLGYPVVSIGAARSSAAGRRVVIRGEVLAGRQTFSDTTAYVRDTSGAIRLTGAAVLVGGFTNPGDTVRVGEPGVPHPSSAPITAATISSTVILPLPSASPALQADTGATPSAAFTIAINSSTVTDLSAPQSPATRSAWCSRAPTGRWPATGSRTVASPPICRRGR
jgi:hypothetical protein